MEIHEDHETAMDSRYYLSASRIGAPTSPQTANQIKEMGTRLNEGVKNIEIGSVSPEVFESIPEPHFKEMKRLGKLTGAETSIHGPGIDIAGLSQQGWSETQRLTAEKNVESVIDRGHELDPTGKAPITLHSGTIPIAEWKKEVSEESAEALAEQSGISKEEARKALQKRAMGVVNQDTGQIQVLKHEERRYLGEKKPVIWTPERRLESLNRTEWDQEKLRLMSFEKNLDEVRDRQTKVMAQNAAYADKVAHGLPMSEGEKKEYNGNVRNINALQNHMNELNDNMRSGFQELHNKFEKFSDKENPNYVGYKKTAYKDMLKNFNKTNSEIEKVYGKIDDLRKRYKKTSDPALAEEMYNIQRTEIQPLYNDQTENIIKDIGSMPHPELWKPADDFAADKGSETIANAAFNSYKKYGDKTPIISLENVYPEMPLARAESLRKAIEDSRERFAKRLVKEENFHKKKAEKVAEKLIGATWDLGHINMLRKFGYDDKDILEESKKIAKVVKHVHVTDNFGFQDSHLPPDMGNVPVKEIMKELEKKGYSGKAIMEAGGFPRFFETSPQPYILEAMGSPLYSIEAAPYWSEIRDTYGRYQMGYGEILPKQHFDFYGAGFSTVPRELGGQAGSPEKGRFATGDTGQGQYEQAA